MAKRRHVQNDDGLGGSVQSPLVLDVIQRLAVRYEDAARMIGISESMLRDLVYQGKIHAPIQLSKNVVLFDVATLAQDWQSIRRERMGDPLRSARPKSALDELLG